MSVQREIEQDQCDGLIIGSQNAAAPIEFYLFGAIRAVFFHKKTRKPPVQVDSVSK